MLYGKKKKKNHNFFKTQTSFLSNPPFYFSICSLEILIAFKQCENKKSKSSKLNNIVD